MTISEWLQQASHLLQGEGINSSRLDAEIILAHTVGHPRSWLHAHSDETIDLRKQEIADARIDLRLDHVPVAYIIGHKEFYGRRFMVSPATLIPRPESEEIIELLEKIMPTSAHLGIDIAKRLVDIGTGSGCLGITAKLEHPELEVTLLDTSKAALTIAEKNARQYNLDILTIQSDLLAGYPFAPDIVLANLPYVDREWTVEPELDHEPADALFADDGGLGIIRRCFDELSRRMDSNGYALFEADPRQWDIIDTIASSCGFDLVESARFAHAYKKR